MKVHPGEEVDLIDLRSGKNKEDITNSRKFLTEFLVNSLGLIKGQCKLAWKILKMVM